jgi:hypothetical protein
MPHLNCAQAQGAPFIFQKQTIFVEIWLIVVICILMLPIFLIANYVVVKKAAQERRSRDDRIERAVSDSVAASYADKGLARQSWPKYKATRKKKE